MFASLFPQTQMQQQQPQPQPQQQPQQPLQHQIPQQAANFCFNGATQTLPIWEQQVRKLVEELHSMGWDICMQNLLTLLKLEQQKEEEIMEKVRKSGDEGKGQWQLSTSKSQVDYVRERCSRIKKRSGSLLVQLLNLRQKMVSQMYMCKVQSKGNQLQLSQLNEAARNLKYQVSHKLNKLKGLKLNNQLEETEASFKQSHSYSIDIPLLQLKKGTEVLEKETLRMKEEFRMLQNLAHGQNLQ